MSPEDPPPLRVGSLFVRVTRSCARRDLYDLEPRAPFPDSLRARLASWGPVVGPAALWILDLPGRHRVTVAPARGRVVILPRMEPERPAQRAHAQEFFAWLERTLVALGQPPGDGA